MKTNKTKSYHAYVWAQINRFTSWLTYPLRRAIKSIWSKIIRYHNQQVLCYLANLSPDAQIELTLDESIMLQKLAELILPSRFATRNGKIRYTAPTLEEVTLWQMIEARRAETAKARVIGWCGNYSPGTVADMLKLSKFIEKEMKQADSFEESLLPNNHRSVDDNPIAEAKNIMGMVQITAELFNCSFEEAKNINYSDAILAISKRNDEVQRQKSKSKYS